MTIRRHDPCIQFSDITRPHCSHAGNRFWSQTTNLPCMDFVILTIDLSPRHHHPRHLPPPKMSRGCSHCCHCWPFSHALRVKDWSATRTLPSGTYAALIVKDWSAAFSMHRYLPLQGHHGYQYAGVTNTKNCSCSDMDTHISGFDGNSHHADNM